MQVKDILIEVPIIKRSDNLRLIIKTYKETGLNMLPVTDAERRLLGIIKFNDIAKAFEPYKGPLKTLVKTIPLLDDLIGKDFTIDQVDSKVGVLCLAEDILNVNFITLDPDEDINKAYSIMRLYNEDTICVAKDGYLLGVIKLIDIIISIFRGKGIVD